jgi:EAL domain-containing protein (putative c-di-GMP-specific phosphodiesterase class I)
VNLPALQRPRGALPALVEPVHAESRLPAERLELELTESVIMSGTEHTLQRLQAFRELGVSLAVDDFGPGYYSLADHKRLPISTLKIDKSFVRDLAHSAGDQAIASSIIGLAHRLKLRVIAEGVETEQQRGFLRANGCDEMQGYLFSEPLPPEQLAALLKRSTGAAPPLARRSEVAA